MLVGANMVAHRKKEYHWLGRPSGLGHGLMQAKAEKLALVARIEEQADHLQVRFHEVTHCVVYVNIPKVCIGLQELLKTHTALNNLIQRNKRASVMPRRDDNCTLQLPFNLIQVWLWTLLT